MSEIIDAIKAGDAAGAAAILDRDPSQLGARDGNITAVLLSLYHGHPEIARLFIERGAELTFPEACAAGAEGRVRAMLDRDPSLANAFSDDGFPALGLAVYFRQPAIARLLIERGADVNAAARNPQKVAPIHGAASIGDRDTVRLLLERGANANARQNMGYVALHTAAMHGDIEMATTLLKHGADPRLATDDGKTAESFAEQGGKTDFVSWLRSSIASTER